MAIVVAIAAAALPIAAQSTPLQRPALSADPLAVTEAITPGIAADGLPGIDLAKATRGSAVQIDDPPPPPSFGGCLIGEGAVVSATIDPLQRYRVDNPGTWWRIHFYNKPGPRGPLVVIGDSITDQAANWAMPALINAGFGPICYDGGWGRALVISGMQDAGTVVIKRIRASEQVWSSARVRWVLALGTNDVRRDPDVIATFGDRIDLGRRALANQTVPLFWMGVRTARDDSWTRAEDAWNRETAARGDVVVPWPAVIDGADDPMTLIYIDLVHLLVPGAEAWTKTLVKELIRQR